MSGTIQLYCDESRIDPEQFETIKTLVDVGDIVGCEGPLKRTDKGELSIVVEDIKVLTKSLRNLRTSGTVCKMLRLNIDKDTWIDRVVGVERYFLSKSADYQNDAKVFGR